MHSLGWRFWASVLARSFVRLSVGDPTLNWQAAVVVIVRGTRKLLDRVKGLIADQVAESTTAMGDWYATVLFWQPLVALFVNESTLLPVLMPFAPAATLLDRFPAALAVMLEHHAVNERFIEHERSQMAEQRLAKTKNRSVIGIMNEFAYLSGVHRSSGDGSDLVALSLWLAQTPCSPLYGRHVSPDRELAALVARASA